MSKSPIKRRNRLNSPRFQEHYNEDQHNYNPFNHNFPINQRKNENKSS